MTTLGSKITPRAFAGTIGIARKDITPPVGIYARNWGPASWNASEGSHRPMTLTALLLGDAPLIVLALDGTWWRAVADEDYVRGTILERLGLPEDALLLSLSHTHAGPVLCATESDLPGGELISGYLDSLIEAAVEAVTEAVTTQTMAVLEWTRGSCSLAANREVQVDGRSLVGFEPERDADDAVLVGRLTSADGVGLGTIVNYACHPTTLAWENRLISPDFVGALRETVEVSSGGPCMFLQGASGELAPRLQYVADPEIADRHGEGLGHAVLAALAELPTPGTCLQLSDVIESGAPLAMWQEGAYTPSSEIKCRQRSVELHVRELASIAELEEQWADIDPRSSEERLRRARNLREDYLTGPTVQHPVWAWRLGDALFVAHPGEAYSPLQQQLRTKFPEHPIVVMNLTNGPGFVYLPTREAYAVDAYQAWQTPLAPGSLERLIDHASTMITELLEENS